MSIKSSTKYKTMRTALLTAFPKVFTDIKYSNEIFSAALKLAVDEGFSFEMEYFSTKMALEIEARYKSLNYMLNSFVKNTDNNFIIIELGSGLSLRRFDFSQIPYYELDMLEINNIKMEIYSKLKLEALNNGLINIDLTDEQNFKSVLKTISHKHPKSKPIVLSEGLFWYLTKADIKNITDILTNVFSSNGFLWITADCPTYKTNCESYRNAIHNSIDNNKKQTFVDKNDFCQFFKSLNYEIREFKMIDLISASELFSSKVFGLGEHEIKRRLNSYSDIAILSQSDTKLSINKINPYL
ncbi:MAG: class I SAM-dependent methyltransferase [Eubacterium sp.]